MRVLDPVTKVAVVVTFLRMEWPPVDEAPSLPPDMTLIRLSAPTVSFYRYLYNTVGADYVWWLRRTMPDRELQGLLTNRAVSIHVLYEGGEPAGFFEIDRRTWPDTNLSYFGLLPHAVGTGIGYAFLRAAIAEGWKDGTKAMTVNTCTADHARALPTYMRAGFRPVRQMQELWSVPNRLGLKIPAHLRA